MVQLTLDTRGVSLILPEALRGGYTITEEHLGAEVTMASGRMVREMTGTVYRINYQRGYLTDAQKADYLTACEKGWREPIECAFLLPSGDIGVSSFLVTDFTFPKYQWARYLADNTETALWGDYSVELREVTPHD